MAVRGPLPDVEIPDVTLYDLIFGGAPDPGGSGFDVSGGVTNSGGVVLITDDGVSKSTAEDSEPRTRGGRAAIASTISRKSSAPVHAPTTASSPSASNPLAPLSTCRNCRCAALLTATCRALNCDRQNLVRPQLLSRYLA